jgi:hypothetical protein
MPVRAKSELFRRMLMWKQHPDQVKGFGKFHPRTGDQDREGGGEV